MRSFLFYLRIILMEVFIGFIIAFCIYFLPTFVARDHKNGNSIAVLNLFLGWTFLGWVVALVWAFKND